MERDNYESFCAKVQTPKALKPQDWNKEAKSREDRVTAIVQEISVNEKALDKATKELHQAMERKGKIGEEFKHLKEKRQDAIAFKQDPQEITSEIRRLRDEQELQDDLCVGLERRVQDSMNEKDLLEAELVEARMAISRFELVPLVAQWNENAKKQTDILKKIIRLENALGESLFYPGTGFKTLIPSNREGFEVIPKLYLAGDIGDDDYSPNKRIKDHFRLREFIGELQQEREKMALEIQGKSAEAQGD